VDCEAKRYGFAQCLASFFFFHLIIQFFFYQFQNFMLGSLGVRVDDFFLFSFYIIIKVSKKRLGIGSMLDFIK
jgi:hypothetical protein